MIVGNIGREKVSVDEKDKESKYGCGNMTWRNEEESAFTVCSFQSFYMMNQSKDSKCIFYLEIPGVNPECNVSFVWNGLTY